jgi:DNA (cytosine-5)-methyltransferase 1
LLERDIKSIEPTEFDDLLTGDLDLLAVCAPCQPFSTQNRHKADSDLRNTLLSASLPFIKHFLPKAIFIENVPGIKKNDAFREFLENLADLGYGVSKPLKLNAATLGVPQRRNRVIVIAIFGETVEPLISFPKLERRTVLQSIGELPPPPIGPPRVGDDPLHFARKHSELNLRRLHHIPPNGGGRESLPEELQLKCHKGKRQSSFSDTYGRMRWDDVAPTLTTGCTDITRGRFAHPEQNRAITLREAARLQSFPDNYVFLGTAGDVAVQIGNAVPPRMMQTIAKILAKTLNSKVSN